MNKDFKEALDVSYFKVLELEEFLHRLSNRFIGHQRYDDPRAYDEMIKASLDLLGGLIVAKADAEVYARYRKV